MTRRRRTEQDPSASRCSSSTSPPPHSTAASSAGRRYDGTGRTTPTTGDSDEPPYETGVAALQDGWRLIQCAPLMPPYPGHEYDVSFLKHEFVFEKLVTVHPG